MLIAVIVLVTKIFLVRTNNTGRAVQQMKSLPLQQCKKDQHQPN